jgi:hypothetical protein
MCETKVHLKLKLFSSALNKEISEMLGVLAIRAAEAMLAPGKSATGPFWGQSRTLAKKELLLRRVLPRRLDERLSRWSQ